MPKDDPAARTPLDADAAALFLSLDRLPVPAWTAAPDGLSEFVNSAYLRFTGLSREQVAGAGWWKALAVGDREETQIAWESSVVTGKPYRHLHRYIAADGAAHMFLAEAAPLRDAKGSITRWVGTSVNIEHVHAPLAALIKDGERYRVLVESVASIVFSANQDGAVIVAQTAWESYTGQSFQDHRGMGWANAVHPDDRSRVAAAWSAALSTGAVQAVPARLWRANAGKAASDGPGEYRGIVAYAAPIRDEDGAIKEWFGAVVESPESVMTAPGVPVLRA